MQIKRPQTKYFKKNAKDKNLSWRTKCHKNAICRPGIFEVLANAYKTTSKNGKKCALSLVSKRDFDLIGHNLKINYQIFIVCGKSISDITNRLSFHNLHHRAFFALPGKAKQA